MDPKVFIGRNDEVTFFRQRLNNAFNNRFQHYVITGTWGIGKTVLLRQMKLVARHEGAWALLFCTRSFSAQEGLIHFAHHVLDMASADLPIQPDKKAHASKRIQGAGASALGFGFQLQWKDSSQDQDPQLLLRNGLIQLYKHAESHGTKVLVILIDDVHNLSSDGHPLTLLRNVLTDERVLEETKILMVLSSIEQAWKPFLLRDHPVGRLFMPRRPLRCFDRTETPQLIQDSLRGTGVAFDDDVKDRIFEVTRGHGFELQALCEALFDQQIKGKVTMENWETALYHTLLALADAQFEGMVGRASSQEKAVLKMVSAREGEVSPRDFEKSGSKIKSAVTV